MEDDGTVTLMIRLSQVSSMPFQVTVNVTAVGKYTVLYGRLISRREFFMDQIVKCLIAIVQEVYIYVWPSQRLLIIIVMMWHNMDPV